MYIYTEKPKDRMMLECIVIKHDVEFVLWSSVNRDNTDDTFLKGLL